jgi:hypothetical protein
MMVRACLASLPAPSAVVRSIAMASPPGGKKLYLHPASRAQGVMPPFAGSVTSTFFQLESGSNDEIFSASWTVSGPRSFWNTAPV